MRIQMQIFTHAWACSCISSQKVLLLSRVCVRQLSDITSNTPTHTLFTDYISLSILRCLQPINIHLSGTSLSLSLSGAAWQTEPSVSSSFCCWFDITAVFYTLIVTKRSVCERNKGRQSRLVHRGAARNSGPEHMKKCVPRPDVSKIKWQPFVTQNNPRKGAAFF